MGAEVSGGSITRIAGFADKISKTVAFRGELSVLCVGTYTVFIFDADPYFFADRRSVFLKTEGRNPK